MTKADSLRKDSIGFYCFSWILIKYVKNREVPTYTSTNYVNRWGPYFCSKSYYHFDW